MVDQHAHVLLVPQKLAQHFNPRAQSLDTDPGLMDQFFAGLEIRLPQLFNLLDCRLYYGFAGYCTHEARLAQDFVIICLA